MINIHGNVIPLSLEHSMKKNVSSANGIHASEILIATSRLSSCRCYFTESKFQSFFCRNPLGLLITGFLCHTASKEITGIRESPCYLLAFLRFFGPAFAATFFALAFPLPPPILNILVPQTEHVPDIALRPFFMVICFSPFISLFFLHFTQYACVTK